MIVENGNNFSNIWKLDKKKKNTLFDIQMQWNWFVMWIFILGSKTRKRSR
jgi:hypothetical protein